MYENTIQNEVEAYLFQGLIEASLGTSLGGISSNETLDGKIYGDATYRLVYGGYDQITMLHAIESFKQGSIVAGRNGIYRKLPLRNNPPQNILINKFLPIK
jgi:hypothetical protein